MTQMLNYPSLLAVAAGELAKDERCYDVVEKTV